MRRLLPLACVLALSAARCGGGTPTLSVFIWTEYVPPEVYAKFEAETGARVVEANFASNEELRAKLQAGAAGYDVVCPTDYTVRELVRDGLLADLDHALLPNLGNLAPRFADPPYDAGLRHSVPFSWGVTGIAYDPAVVDPAPTSWRDLLDPEHAAPYAGRISMLNDVRELVSAALLAEGRDPNSQAPGELDAAAQLLTRQKALVAKYDSDTPGASLVSGEVVLAQAWSGTIAGAQAERSDLRFLVPPEGALVYVDNWAIPKSAPHRELAHRFIDFCLRPDIAAEIAEATLYASCNDAAKERLDPAVLQGTSYADGGGAQLSFLADAGAAAPRFGAIWKALKGE